MPVDRTPPPVPPQQQTALPARSVQRQRSDSEPSLCDIQPNVESVNIAVRTKRKRSEDGCNVKLSEFMAEIKQILFDFKTEQEHKFKKIHESIAEIKKQNSDISASVDYVSKSYDSLLEQINQLKLERQENLDYIRALEDKLDKTERHARSSCVEIRNLPPTKQESKNRLLDTIIMTGNCLDIPIQPHEVRDVFRIHSKEAENKPIIVDFTTVLMKEKFIHKYKQYTKNTRLTTEHLKINGPSKPIFISENLSPKMKRLFYLCRDFSKVYDYKYCWVTHGKIYLRKIEGAPSYLIKNDTDLSNLKVPK